MYAIIITGGKQYKVEAGQQLFIEKLDAEEGSEVVFDQVVAIGDDKKGLQFGTPLLAGATVTAKVLKNGKAKKIDVFTYKRRKGYHRSIGHRQPYTKVEIAAISAKPKRKPAARKPKVEKVEVAETPAAVEPAAETTEA